jgi:hypothetical protein
MTHTMTNFKPSRDQLRSRTRGACRSASFLIVCFSILLGSSSARAEEVSAENTAAARDLAREGIRLAQEGKCNEALDPLTRAEALFHAPTILTWLGQCQIEIGRLVEGTENLNRVVREKTAPEAPDAYLQAKKRAAVLIETTLPKIAKLTIVIEPKDAGDLIISVNGRTISSALIGAPRPSDPGKQLVSVSAPGYQEAVQEIELNPGAIETLTLTLTPTQGSVATTETAGSPKEASAPKEPKGATWVGWTLVGGGGALAIAGGLTGYFAISKKNDLDCPTEASCPESESDTLKSARLNATLSTIFVGVGAAAITTGVVLLITGQPKVPSAEVGSLVLKPSLSLGGAGLSGTF